MRPTYRARNKAKGVRRRDRGEEWVYFYDVGPEELKKLKRKWDIVQRIKMAEPP